MFFPDQAELWIWRSSGQSITGISELTVLRSGNDEDRMLVDHKLLRASLKCIS